MRKMFCALMLIASVALTEPQPDYMRQDIKDLTKALSDFSQQTVSDMSNLRARMEIFEKQLEDTKEKTDTIPISCQYC
jgi:hypothetical protein